MLSFQNNLKIYLAIEACDMRKSFNGLYAIATEQLNEDPRKGSLFVFRNRRKNRIKILYYDGSGLWVLAKRLEKGTFSWPKQKKDKIHIEPEALSMLINGIDMRDGCRRSWYERE